MTKKVPGTDDLIYSRGLLEALLRQQCETGAGVATVVYRSRATVKHLYQILDAPAADEVRHRMAGLAQLKKTIEDNPYLVGDISNHRGLWLPAVADIEAGDTQVNVAISENWTSETATGAEIAELMCEPEGAPAWAALADAIAEYGEEAVFSLCRASGKTCRVAIRNPGYTDDVGKLVGRLVWSINDFCIVLGPVPIKFPPTPKDRVRHKRSDAWMGVETPLFCFSAARGREWEVHAPRGG